MKIRIKALSFIFLLLFTLNVYAQETLVYSVCMVRHGDRTPWSDAGFTNIHYKWPYSLGELTPLGINQEYQVGKLYREKYVDRWHLLNPQYQNGSVFVLSTEMNRTVMSGQSLLTGLYPPGTGPKLANGQPALPDALQPIPIFTIPAGAKNIISREQEDPSILKSMMLQVLATPKFAALNQNYQPDLKRWGNLLGTTIPNIRDLIGSSDYLNCMLQYNAPLPVGLTKAEAERIINSGFKIQAEMFAVDEITRYMASAFMRKLDLDLRAAASGNQKYKLTLYIGHDISLLGIMSAIKAPLPTNPDYASHVEFDLFHEDDGSYVVKATYNNAPVKFANTGKAYCTLDQFTALIQPVTAQ
ncbi:MAG: histidine phosphatase family protein [Negativicutes bacterium]|jgi:acid phosphatase